MIIMILISFRKMIVIKEATVVPEEGVSIGADPQPPVIDNPDPPINTQGSYKIQLAALRNTRWFNPSTTILSLGQIEDRPRGDLTIKLLSSFNTLGSAQQALSVVKQNGFATAFIVQDVNGTLQRVKN